jgi:5-deoxy-glucuronate isomerase
MCIIARQGDRFFGHCQWIYPPFRQLKEEFNMPRNLYHQPGGFGWGFTWITRINETNQDSGIGFGILRLRSGEEKDLTSDLESAYLLTEGKVIFTSGGERHSVKRNSIFDENPFVIHFAARSSVFLRAESDCEMAVCQAVNDRTFPTRLFGDDGMLENEERGKGLLNDAARRIVRTFFNYRNRPESNMVLGETINLPGLWSSYPPHHHPHPEIYRYRFTKPQGYGHAELGENVYKIRHYDTLIIKSNKDHSQVSAPGYGMYYIWVIRHLPGNPYVAPEFTADHKWANEPDAEFWGSAKNPKINT